MRSMDYHTIYQLENAVVRMKPHENSDTHIQATQASLALERTHREGSIIQQLQRAESQERISIQLV